MTIETEILENIGKGTGILIGFATVSVVPAITETVSEADPAMGLASPMAVYDNVEYLKKEQELIRHAIKAEIPIICFISYCGIQLNYLFC